MDLINNDGLTRRQRMHEINKYSQILTDNKKIANKDVDAINKQVSSDIRTPIADTALGNLRNTSTQTITTEMATLISDTRNMANSNITQIEASITISTNSYLTTIYTEISDTADVIEAQLNADVAAYIVDELIPTALKELEMWQEGYDRPLAATKADAKSEYILYHYAQRLNIIWAFDNGSTKLQMDNIYIDFEINKALQISNNINIIGVISGKAAAVATVTGDVVTDIALTNEGGNYESAPLITFISDVGGLEAAATCSITKSVTEIRVITEGQGYFAPPTITISGGGGQGATAKIIISKRYFTIEKVVITNAGSGYTSIPTVTMSNIGNTVIPAQLEALIGNGVVGNLLLVNGGTGYSASNPPKVYFIGGNCALVTAKTDSEGSITDTIIVKRGKNYSPTPSIVFMTHRRLATATVSLLNGGIDTFNIIEAGSEYDTAPNVYIYGSGIGATAIATVNPMAPYEIILITPVTPGSGYTGTVVVVIGQGDRASATVSVNLGSLTEIDLLTKGANYTFPTITITGSGKNAIAAAKIGIGSIVEVIIVNEGSGYSQSNTVVSITGNAQLAPVVTNGKIVSITIIDGGFGYTYPVSPSSTDEYRNYYVRNALCYPNSVDSAVASVNYFDKKYKTALGYPRASSATEAEADWLKNYMTYLSTHPEVVALTTPISVQNQMYKDAFGFPNAFTVGDAENKYYTQKLQELAGKVACIPPADVQPPRRSMNIAVRTDNEIPRYPKYERKEDQYETNVPIIRTAALIQSNKSRIIRSEEVYYINHTLKGIEKIVDGNIVDINYKVSFDYRYPDAYNYYIMAIAGAEFIANAYVAGITSTQTPILTAEANNIYNDANIENTVKLATIEDRIIIDRGVEADEIIAKVDANVDAIVNSSETYKSETDVVIANIKKDIDTINDIVQADVNQYSSYIAHIIIKAPFPASGATAVISEIIDGKGNGYSVATVNITGGNSDATADALIVDSRIIAYEITNPGTGYIQETTTINITGDGTDAYAEIVVDSNGAIFIIRPRQGIIKTIEMTNKGFNYNDKTRMSICAAKGSGAILTPNIINGSINSITVNDGGSNYLSPVMDINQQLEIQKNALSFSMAQFTSPKGIPYIQIPSANPNGLPLTIPNTDISFRLPYYTYLDGKTTELPDTYSLPYYNFRVKNDLGYPNAATAQDAIDNYEKDRTLAVLGYPNAPTIAAGGILAKESRKKDNLGFPNVQTVNMAKSLYIDQYVDIALGYPNYVTKITVTNGGKGYKSNPVVKITGGGSKGGAALASIGGGSVTNITLVNRGIGYRRSPTIKFVGGGGTGATVDANVDITTGVITGFSNLAGGINYTSNPSVVIEEFVNSTPATAVACINFRGEVNAVQVISPGGYCVTDPIVTFYGGGGIGATAVTNTIPVSSDYTSTTNWLIKNNYKALGVNDISLSVPEAKTIYINNGLKIAYGFSNADSKDEAELKCYNLQYRTNLGYPDASPVTIDSIIPKEFLNTIDRTIFPADTPNTAANLLWFYNQMEFYKTTIPPSQTAASINMLYRTAFGYPDGVTIVEGGSGYTADTYIEIIGSGSGATAIPIIIDGVITDIEITNKGKHYLTPPTIRIHGKGKDASATATINGQYEVNNINVSNGGMNYINSPMVHFTGGRDDVNDALAAATIDEMGRVNVELDPDQTGTGYTLAPSIIIFGPVQNNVIVAIATATTDGNTLTGISMTNVGLGYLEAPRVFIVRSNDAQGFLGVQDEKISAFFLTTGGSGYVSKPTANIYTLA